MADPVTPVPSTKPHQAEIDALVIKHHAEIDRIQVLDSAGQQAALRALGVDPAAVQEHYKDLFDRSEKLRHDDIKATHEKQVLGVSVTVLATGGALAMGKKLGSWAVRGFIIPIVALGSGFIGMFAGSRLFSGKRREESRQLNIEARNALDREVAVALENRDRGQGAALAAPGQAVPAEMVPAAMNITPRDPSFAAQAATEKTAAATQTQRA